MSGATALARAKKESSASATKQLNVRVPTILYNRLEDAAEGLATDPSHLVRMILAEKLPEYEERARRAKGESD